MRHAGGGAVRRAGRAIVVFALLTLAGCSAGGGLPQENTGSTEPNSQAPDPPGTAGPRRDASCGFLTSTEIAELAGEQLPEPHPWNVGGLPACQWGTPEGVAVQVISVPAEIWAMRVPAVVEQLRASGLFDDTRNTRQLEEAGELLASGEQLDSGRACELFSLMLEIQGRPSGTARVINLIPTEVDPRAIAGQTCTRDTFTSVMLVAPGLSGGRAEVARVSSALTRAHARGAE